MCGNVVRSGRAATALEERGLDLLDLGELLLGRNAERRSSRELLVAMCEHLETLALLLNERVAHELVAERVGSEQRSKSLRLRLGGEARERLHRVEELHRAVAGAVLVEYLDVAPVELAELSDFGREIIAGDLALPDRGQVVGLREREHGFDLRHGILLWRGLVCDPHVRREA